MKSMKTSKGVQGGKSLDEAAEHLQIQESAQRAENQNVATATAGAENVVMRKPQAQFRNKGLPQ